MANNKSTHYILPCGSIRHTQEYEDAYLEWWLKPTVSRSTSPKIIKKSSFNMDMAKFGPDGKFVIENKAKSEMDKVFEKLGKMEGKK